MRLRTLRRSGHGRERSGVSMRLLRLLVSMMLRRRAREEMISCRNLKRRKS
jgi:hypothetical protein